MGTSSSDLLEIGNNLNKPLLALRVLFGAGTRMTVPKRRKKKPAIVLEYEKIRTFELPVHLIAIQRDLDSEVWRWVAPVKLRTSDFDLLLTALR
jgi:hypothetical protein